MQQFGYRQFYEAYKDVYAKPDQDISICVGGSGFTAFVYGAENE